MTEFRPIRQEEIAPLWERVKKDLPWIAEPAWGSVTVKVVDGQIRSMYGRQFLALAEPVWGESPQDVRDAMMHLDGSMLQMGVKVYEFFVPNHNSRMQQAIEKHFGIEGTENLPGKVYQVKRDG